MITYSVNYQPTIKVTVLITTDFSMNGMQHEVMDQSGMIGRGVSLGIDVRYFFEKSIFVA